MVQKSIYFDLETTSTSFVGQILNFCFVTVDENFNKVKTLKGDVKLSRLQLPEPGAILANKVNVLLREAKLSEFEAAKTIWSFLCDESKDGVALIGYNSNRFDFDFLKTTLNRNGFIPPSTRLKRRDLLHAVRYLCAKNPEIRKALTRDDKLVCTLENVSQTFGLLDGAQSHEAEADVELSIKLGKYILDNFGVDVRTLSGYEPPILSKYEVVSKVDGLIEKPYCLLDENLNGALWVDLGKFKEVENKREAVFYYNKNKSDFFLGETEPEPLSLDFMSSIEEAYKGVTLDNFFSEPKGDIEVFIYKMKNEEIIALGDLIRGKELRSVPTDNTKRLWGRWRLANLPESDPFVQKNLPEYAKYRYGGGMNLGADNPKIHKTATELFMELESLRKSESGENREILDALREYYLSSPMFNEFLKAA